MCPGPRILVAAAVVAAFATPAAAQLASYQVEGEADVGVAEPRVVALDAAFAAAVHLALDDLVAAGERKARKADLDREIFARSRLWVASFKVTSDRTDADRRKLDVHVKVSLDTLRGRLVELGVTLELAPDAPAPVAAATRTATVLVRVIAGRGAVASYGAAAEADVAALAQLAGAVRAAGWHYVPPPATGPAPGAGEAPLDDRAARELADAVNAELAVIITIDPGEPAAVRGSTERAALARARVRVIDRAGGVIGQGAAVGAARGGGDDITALAVASAVLDAFGDARPVRAAPAGPVAALTAGVDEILVRVTARERGEAPPWVMVHAIRARLATLKATDVAYRRLATREVVIGVRGPVRPDKVAREIRDLERKITDTSFQTKIDGNQIEVRVSGSP